MKPLDLSEFDLVPGDWLTLTPLWQWFLYECLGWTPAPTGGWVKITEIDRLEGVIVLDKDSGKRVVKMFRAARDSRRFRRNQKVWVKLEHANHLTIRFRWRGKGRYVSGVIDKFDTAVGVLRDVEVGELFAQRHDLQEAHGVYGVTNRRREKEMGLR